MQKILLIFLIFILLISCKSIVVKDKDTTGKIIFRDLLNDSKKINEVYISGLLRIDGVKELPAVFLHFESQGKIKEAQASFRISSFKTPLIDIDLNGDDVLLINHTGMQYLKLNMEQIDFSKVTGLNFNPIELSYFFLGKVPYSESMELMEFKWNRSEYILNVTDSDSKYTLYMNIDKEIVAADIFSQYFDNITLDSIKYQKNEENINMPHMLSFSAVDRDIKISFIINKISYKNEIENFIDMNALKDYQEIDSLDDIKIIIKNKERN